MSDKTLKNAAGLTSSVTPLKSASPVREDLPIMGLPVVAVKEVAPILTKVTVDELPQMTTPAPVTTTKLAEEPTEEETVEDTKVVDKADQDKQSALDGWNLAIAKSFGFKDDPKEMVLMSECIITKVCTGKGKEFKVLDSYSTLNLDENSAQLARERMKQATDEGLKPYVQYSAMLRFPSPTKRLAVSAQLPKGINLKTGGKYKCVVSYVSKQVKISVKEYIAKV